MPPWCRACRRCAARWPAGDGASPLSVLPIDRWMALMRVDKKAEGGEIRFVVIDGLGRAAMRPAPDALVPT
jgi:3-dehydroquinate synthetase